MKVVLAFLVNTLFNFAIGLLVATFLGPEQFGRFALALAIGMTIQVGLFDWIRLTAVRFYSERSRRDEPALRATLDLSFATAAGIVALALGVVLLAKLDLPLPPSLLVLACAAAITNGFFDYQTALVRARFHDGLYGRLILTKNVLALVLTAGGALLFGSAIPALIGVGASMAGSVVLARGAMRDPGTALRLAQKSVAKKALRYSLPIVAANVLYLLIPLATRALVTQADGFGETGQFSLAFDIGTRIVAAIGTALDVLLFQLAVRADEVHGAGHARAQVARNMTVVLAVLGPACLGLWLVLPSLESLLVPAQFRGPFGHYLAILLPGLFAFGMMNFAINPVFQIRQRTLPLIGAAAVAVTTYSLVLLMMPAATDAPALAQTAAFSAAAVALIAFAVAEGAQWPRLRDLAAILLGLGAMAAALLPLRGWTSGLATLLVQVTLGGALFAAILFGFDLAGLRTPALAWLKARAFPVAGAKSSRPA